MGLNESDLSVVGDLLLEGRVMEATKFVATNNGLLAKDGDVDQVVKFLSTFRPTPLVGDILESSWGYGQTRCYYYQVIAVTAKGHVRLKKIEKHCVSGGYNMPTDAYVTPVPGSFCGDAFLKKVTRGPAGFGYRVSISDYASARLWDGDPGHESGDY